MGTTEKGIQNKNLIKPCLRIPQKRLLYKIKAVFPGSALSTHEVICKFCVKHCDDYSQVDPIIAGVPHGSVLRSVLYNLYTEYLLTEEKCRSDYIRP